MAVASGVSVRDAAKQTRVSERSAYRWSREPEFRQSVHEIREQLCSQLTASLSQAAKLAIQTLEELMRTGSQGVQLGAAKATLDLGLRYNERFNLVEQLGDLEDQLAELRAANTGNRERIGNPFPQVPQIA